MSIPLDRLYHYIESVANKIYNGDIIIYRFDPHGSKNIDHLSVFKHDSFEKVFTSIELICFDQEPLDYDYYKHAVKNHGIPLESTTNQEAINEFKYSNLRYNPGNINDKCLLLHSEQKSNQVLKYSQNQYIPVYYWSHAIIALDWYRYAKHLTIDFKNTNKKFLVYNREWSGTREYRLKFADLLIEVDLVNQCHMRCSFKSHGKHYSQYNFKNKLWRPKNLLEDYYKINTYHSHASADFVKEDYQTTDIEVVLETLFDDQRHHLTEKTLRPMALGQPFILAATAGSLKYLRSYGFKTFEHIIDESYDDIEEPSERLNKIVELMTNINNLPPDKYSKLIEQLNEIARYNKQHFFSDNFFNQVVNELKQNLSSGIFELISTNTYERFINLRQKLEKSADYIKWRAAILPEENIKVLESVYQLAISLKKENNK